MSDSEDLCQVIAVDKQSYKPLKFKLGDEVMKFFNTTKAKVEHK
jgi:hypothetical protein